MAYELLPINTGAVMGKKGGEVTGYLHDEKELELCIGELRKSNFSTNDIIFSITEDSGVYGTLLQNNHDVLIESMVAGTGVGAALGSMLGFLLGAVSNEFFNTTASAGFGTYFSVFVGMLSGALFGALGGAVVGQYSSKRHNLEDKMSLGEFKVSVHVTNQAQVQLAKFILAEFGGTNIRFKVKGEERAFADKQEYIYKRNDENIWRGKFF